MHRLASLSALRSIVLLSFLSLCLSSAHAANRPARTPRQCVPSFQSWMSGVLSSHPSFAPTTPDNWLGGMGNWSNPADWSAGEPGSGSDVTINTGNDHVNLDVSATINSLTLGGSTGTSQLTGSSGNNLTIAGALTVNSTGTLSLNGDVSVNGQFDNRGTVNLRYGSASFGSLNNYSGAVFRAGADTVLGNVSSDGIISVVSLGQNEPPVSFAIGGNL